MKKTEWLLLIGIVIVLLAGTFSIIFYFNYQNSKCVANPFVYGSQVLEESSADPVEVYGKIILISPEGKRTPTIKFNSSSMWFEWVN